MVLGGEVGYHAERAKARAETPLEGGHRGGGGVGVVGVALVEVPHRNRGGDVVHHKLHALYNNTGQSSPYNTDEDY